MNNIVLTFIISSLILIAFFYAFQIVIPYIQKQYYRLKRYRIGSWESEESWEKAVINTTKQWLNKPPVITINESNVLFKKTSSPAVQSWQEAELLLGYKSTGERDISKYNESAKKHLSLNLQRSSKIDLASLCFAILHNNEDPYNYKDIADTIIQIIESNMDESGLISYSQGKDSSVLYVDTLGMVCPFLMTYGKVYRQPHYQELAIKQLEYFHNHGLYEDSCLPCHAIDKVSNLPLGVIGWGRGTAWYIKSLLDSLDSVTNEKKKEQIILWLHEAADKYLQYQAIDGGYNYILQTTVNYDSSVTAAMAYLYIKCYGFFSDPRYYEAYQKCITKLMTVTMKNGAVDLCQGDTFGLGIFSRLYDIMPFAQGFVVRAFEEAKKYERQNEN